jgi:TM2 domain-containing membrane protein YozV
MLAWLLDPIAAGLTRLYGRPLGHDVAIVFLLAFVLTIVVAARRSRPGSSGVTAALGVPLMSPSGTRRLLTTTLALWRGSAGTQAVSCALAATVIAVVVTAFPLAVGASLVLHGEIARGIIYTLLGYLWIWIFLGLLPVWLLAGWYEYGFWQSVLGNGLLFLVLSSPEWLMARAHRAAPAAGDVTAHAAANEGAP